MCQLNTWLISISAHPLCHVCQAMSTSVGLGVSSTEVCLCYAVAEGLIATDAWRAVQARTVSRYKETGRITKASKVSGNTSPNLARCKMRFAFGGKMICGTDKASYLQPCLEFVPTLSVRTLLEV